MKSHYITGIDVGNAQVKVIIAKIDNGSFRPEIVGVSTAISSGLRRGMVVDTEETISNIRSAIEHAQDMANFKVRRAYLSVSGLHIGTQVSRGVIAVSRADNEISQNDIDRVLQAAAVISLPANREVIHVIPRNYIVDGKEYVKNPLGMKGVRLEAEVFIIDGLSPHLKNIAHCLNENNIEVAELVFAPLAASLAVLDKNQKEYGVLHLDFGGQTSTLSVFEEADLLHTAVLPIGSRHITNDLAIALRTSIDIAERVKIEHGSTAEIQDMRKKDMIDLSEILAEENYILPKKQLIRVIDARMQELVDMVGIEMKKIPRNGMLPAGVVLSGGGSNLPGFATLVKDRLRLPVRIAAPLNIDGIGLLGSDPSYSVAAGLVAWGFEKEFGGGKQRGGGFKSMDINSSNTARKVLNWLKNFLP
ncbi:MAG: Cell division protein ftsA [Parcubacteria group bacterium GW2011_GWC1_39_29]|uniref:Cell division protein FtsA n=1 Tax=Candidatus Yanofskybacteria bacterium GW2011_GWD1_39_16 TaxID=1619030 RepID=A0A837HRZ7_9BACT|nr:MAG: Cell division protein ftsA [Candidatus Yanofskybacteria bacterium GW2011_GWD1_39_16]KKR14825.1 MAG: Cell division protein ftsA [Parcubacteria group bacterium GW2011_GWC1_39_29]